MKFRQTDAPSAAAAKASFSAATAYRFEADPRLPSAKMAPRDRRRPDPLAAIFEAEVVPMLTTAPGLRPIAVFAEMVRRHPELGTGIRRTLARRIRAWRAVRGAEQEVIFRQVHEPGRVGLSDFRGSMMATIRPELLDELLSGYEQPSDLLGEEGLFKHLKKALLERALGAELTEHLGYEKGDPAGRGSGNSRNGHGTKTVLSEDGEISLSVPRDRNATFEPLIVPKGVTRLDGFDDRIISLYARGLTVREIQGHLEQIYGIEVSPDLISRVTDAVLDEVKEWQNRPLDPVYPVVFLDALRVKIRDDGLVRNKAVYVALALTADGDKEVLGLWIEQTEGAKFWLKVMNELKTRGLQDILIAVVDGLKGFPEAIGAVFPQATVQTCIVHLIRNSLAFVSWKDRKAILPALRAIYRAETAEVALDALAAFEAAWGKRYPAIGALWRRAWEHVVPFFVFPPAIRRMVYTTNAVESLNRSLRKVIKTRGSFPTDEAALKLLFLAIRHSDIRWNRAITWTEASAQFTILYGDRFCGSAR